MTSQEAECQAFELMKGAEAEAEAAKVELYEVHQEMETLLAKVPKLSEQLEVDDRLQDA